MKILEYGIKMMTKNLIKKKNSREREREKENVRARICKITLFYIYRVLIL